MSKRMFLAVFIGRGAVLAVFILTFLCAFGCTSSDDDDSSDDDAADDADDADDDISGFSLASTAFDSGNEIPVAYTCDNTNYGQGVSPPLSWMGAPADTLFFALTVYDPDADNTAHWGVFDIPPDVNAFADGLRPESSLPGNAWEALNYLNEEGYAGPCPPEGSTHHYIFTIYALNEAMPDFMETPTIQDLQDLIGEYLIDSAEMTATYSR